MFSIIKFNFILNLIFKLHFFIVIILISCKNDESYINTYKIYKSPIKQDFQKSQQQKKFYWEKPESWIESEGSSMRLATFQVPYSSGYAELSVSEIGGDGGGIKANVNRWRKQLGLSEQSISEINASANYYTNLLGRYSVFKIINKENYDNAYVCAIMPWNDLTIFIKLYIPKIGIYETENDFINFCQSFSISK